jgi:hypothetical protein
MALITINQGNMFLVTRDNGEINSGSELGFFAQDRWFVSRYEIRIERTHSNPVTSLAISYDATYVINDEVRRNRISGNFMNWILLVARNTDERGTPGVPVFRTQVPKRAWLTADVVGLYPEATP